MKEIERFLSNVVYELGQMEKDCEIFLSNAPEGTIYVINNKNTKLYIKARAYGCFQVKGCAENGVK